MEENIAVVESSDPTPLKHPWELFKKAVSEYKAHFRLLAFVSLIPGLITSILVSALGFLMVFFQPSATIFSLLVLVLLALTILLYGWAWSALIIAVDQRGSIRFGAVMKQSFQILLPYWWLGILSALVLLGAFMFFLIPGIIASVWFSLAFFTLVLEKKRGVSALIQSREYIRGHWWPVFWRMFFLLGAVILLLLLLSLLFLPLEALDGSSYDIVLNLISILIAPIIALYWYQIYQDLKFTKKPEMAKKGSWYIWLLSLVGVIMLILAVFSPALKLGFEGGLQDLDEAELNALFEKSIQEELDGLNLEGEN